MSRRQAVRRAVAGLGGLLAVGGPAGCGSPAPTRFQDCAAIASPTEREDCRFALARSLLDDPAALQAAIDSVESTLSRDLLRLRLAVAEPTRAAALCAGVETRAAQEKCRQVLGRPHLSTRPQAPRPPAPVDP